MRKLTKRVFFGVVGLLLIGGAGFSLFRLDEQRKTTMDPSRQAAETASPDSKAPAPFATPPQPAREGGGASVIVGVEEELRQSLNMRALVHDSLRNGDRRSTFVALGAINKCALFPLNAKLFSEKNLADLNQQVAQRWRRLVVACEAAGGIDRQQMRAVSSLVKNKYPDLVYLNEALQANEAEREVIDDLSSSFAAARWLDKKVELGAVKMLLANGSIAPEATSSLAIQVEACTAAFCDPLEAMVVLCAQQGLCSQSTFAEQVSEIVRREGKISANDWELLRVQARESLLKFFPKIMQQPRT